MKPYYTPAEAAAATGASRAAIRTYTQRYARSFSTEATPEEGRARRFTAADLKLIAFIRDKTTGELERFAWEPPLSTGEQALTEGGEHAALVPSAQLQAIQALLTDAQRREQQAQERLATREQELHARINDLTRQLGEVQGEFKAYKAHRRRPTWLVWLFGGEA
jgi:DNA-binding transcriptional MerR regulator